MRWQGRKESSNIEDRRGSGGGNFGGGRGTGIFGIIILLVGAYYGVDLSGLVGTPDSFTHGTSAQRLEWFRKGLQSANPSVCNTFN